MSATPEEQKLVSEIRERFPDAAIVTDQWLSERGFDQHDLLKMTYAWIEAFADRTTDAVRNRNADVVRQHTNFMSERYLAGSEAVRGLIAVAYTENLMWNVGDEEKAWAWPNIVGEVRRLYAELWGAPRL